MVLMAALRAAWTSEKNSSVLLCYATQASMKFAQLLVCPAKTSSELAATRKSFSETALTA